MAFRKPIWTITGGLIWWNNIKQDLHYIMQEHKTGVWLYKYRIIMRQNKYEIANSNDKEEIEKDWEFLQSNPVPQQDASLDPTSWIINMIDDLL